MTHNFFVKSDDPGNSITVSAGSDRYAVRRILPPKDVPRNTPVLVFLHEGLGAIGMWKTFPDSVSAALGFPAIVYDRLGHGSSGPTRASRGLDFFEIEAFRDLPDLLTACGIERPVLIGHSDGGTIALLHAGHHPVRAVVTLAAHVFVEPESLTGVAAARKAWAETDFPDRLARYHGDQTATMFAAWADMWDADWFYDWNIEAALAGIRCPVLAIQGADDNYGTPAQLDAIARGVSGTVQTVLIPDCGHSPHLESREKTLSLLTGFLQATVS